MKNFIRAPLMAILTVAILVVTPLGMEKMESADIPDMQTQMAIARGDVIKWTTTCAISTSRDVTFAVLARLPSINVLDQGIADMVETPTAWCANDAATVLTTMGTAKIRGATATLIDWETRPTRTSTILRV